MTDRIKIMIGLSLLGLLIIGYLMLTKSREQPVTTPEIPSAELDIDPNLSNIDPPNTVSNTTPQNVKVTKVGFNYLFQAKTLGYQFMIPDDWYFNDQNNETDIHVWNKVKEIPDGPGMRPKGLVVVEIQAGIKANQGEDMLTTFNSYTGYDSDGYCLCASGKITNRLINGHQVIMVEHSGGEGPTGPGYFIQRDPENYFYVLVYGESEPEIVEGIVRSLQFTN